MEKIPEILTTISGEKIDNAIDWENFRRREILNLFEEYVYGVRDIERPENLYFEVKSEKIVFLKIRNTIFFIFYICKNYELRHRYSFYKF